MFKTDVQKSCQYTGGRNKSGWSQTHLDPDKDVTPLMRLEVEAPESRTLILRAPAHLKGLKPMSFILALLALLPFVFRAASVLSRLSCAASRSCILLGEDISDRHFSEQSMPEYPLFQWKKKKAWFPFFWSSSNMQGGKKRYDLVITVVPVLLPGISRM